LFAARDALFGPILVAQSGELAPGGRGGPAPRHDPTQVSTRRRCVELLCRDWHETQPRSPIRWEGS
jgi:hypothetical protein